MFLMSRRATDGVCTHRYHVGRACPAPAGSCSRTSICRDTAPAESVARWMSGADEDSRSRSRHHRAVKSARVAEGAADWPPRAAEAMHNALRRFSRTGATRSSAGAAGREAESVARPVWRHHFNATCARADARAGGCARAPSRPTCAPAMGPWGACARTPLSHRRARRGRARRPSVGSGRHMSRDHLVTTT